MLIAQSILLAVLMPSLVFAALFPKDSMVKMLDAKGFKKALKVNQTSMVAFVAPWCGHCQRMSPEYSKAALGLYPLVPVYAVDCDAEQNKRLCAEQEVKGFPTVKLFPRGRELPPMTYDSGERTASAFFYWASRRVPNHVTKLYKPEDLLPWVESSSKSDKPRALLLTKDKKVPLLWKVLGNRYKDQIVFATHRDRKGKGSVEIGLEAGGKKESKVLVYPIGALKPVRYEGKTKLDALTKFFDSVVDGTADLLTANEAAASDAANTVVDPTEEEILQKQEAQRMALAHGGFSDFIDFEAAVKSGMADKFHDSFGYGSDVPFRKDKKESQESSSASSETASSTESAAEPHPTSDEADPQPLPGTDDVPQAVFSEPTSATGAVDQCTKPPSEADACGAPDTADSVPLPVEASAPTSEEGTTTETEYVERPKDEL